MGAYDWLQQPWWQTSQQYFPGVPESITAPIVESESSGNPNALGDYWNSATKKFEQNPSLGAPTSYGLYQLHTPGGQGDGYPTSMLLNPLDNARIASIAIVPAYQQAKAQGYTGFDLAYQTARLSGHTIPRASLQQSYDSYMSTIGAADNVPTSATGAERALSTSATTGSGLENALLAANSSSPGMLATGATYLLGVLVAVILVGLGLWLALSPSNLVSDAVKAATDAATKGD